MAAPSPHRYPTEAPAASAPVSAPTRVHWLAVPGIAAVAFAVILPFFFRGNASGHDYDFHIASWLDVAQQWKQGVLYPRWAEWANFGFGEARFIFYPPASWMLGAALGLVLPWKLVPGAYIFLALVLAGVAMYRLAREWMPTPESNTWATVAAMLYAANPYNLLMAYFRSDFAELLAAGLLPLVVLYALRLNNDAGGAGGRARILRGDTIHLAIVFAAVWLTNAPAAVVMTYSLTLLVVVLGLERRSLAPILSGFGAMALGLALAAFYILPASYEQRWVNIKEVLSAGLRPEENFVFRFSNDPEHNWFNLIVSSLAAGEITLAGAAAALLHRSQSPRVTRLRPICWALLALGAAAAALMFPVTRLAWQWLPKLRYVQFPWRWLLALGVVFAAFLALALRESRRPLVWTALLALALIGTGDFVMRQTWWDAEDIPAMRAAIAEGKGYEGTDEYDPAGANHDDLPAAAPRVAVLPVQFGAAALPARVHVELWRAEEKVFTVDAAQESTAALRLLNYPAWRVEVNSHAVRAESHDDTGQMLIPLAAGQSRVRVRWVRTWDCTAGALITVVSACVVLWIAFRRRPVPDG